MLTIGDIVALAKQGYKPSDIKELLALTGGETDDKQNTPPADEKDPADEEEPEEKADDDKPNYEKLYNDLLKEKQEANRRQENAGEPPVDTQEALNKIMRKFM